MMTLLKKLSTRWNTVIHRCQQLVLQPHKIARSERRCISFRHPLLTVCLLSAFPKRKLLLSASSLIRDKMVVSDSAVAGESSIQYFWIFTCLFHVHLMTERRIAAAFVCENSGLNSQFPGRGWLFSPSKQLPFPLNTLSPNYSLFC